MDEHGEVKLRRVTSAVDTGIAVNPDTIVAQLQGGLIFGLTAALYGEITIDKGRVRQSNFNDYRMLRIDQVPNDRGACHQERRGAGRHRRNRLYGGAAGAAQCDLCRDRRGASPLADRPRRDRGEQSVSVMRTRIVLIVVVVLIVAPCIGWMTFGPGPMAFAGGPTVALADYHGADPDRRSGCARRCRPNSNVANISRGPPIAWSATPRLAAQQYAGGLAITSTVRQHLFDQHHARQRDRHRRLQRSRFSQRCSHAASAATARGFIRPCHTRPIPT